MVTDSVRGSVWVVTDWVVAVCVVLAVTDLGVYFVGAKVLIVKRKRPCGRFLLRASPGCW
jgi:hypothetical protein